MKSRRILEDNDPQRPVAFEDAVALHATERALKVRLADGREIWIPQSQVHDDSDVYDVGHAGRLVVTAWYAQKQGLV